MNTTYQNNTPKITGDQIGTPPRYIHTIVDGVQKGPYSLGEIITMIQNGEITLDSYMWKPGMTDWKPAREIDDIGPNFNINPPAAPETCEP